MCWIAVVFDFLHKLGELAVGGDKQAQSILDDFEKIQRAGDVRASQAFETQVIEDAEKKFEFISAHQATDLVRLRDDRHRCAHPAMNTGEDAYEISPEQARTHIRNVVVHLLEQPPVQGKAALQRLMDDVSSEYFPTDPRAAGVILSRGPLARPKEALVRNFVLATMKEITTHASQVEPSRRLAAALEAVWKLHPAATEAALEAKLSDFMGAVILEHKAPDYVFRFFAYVPRATRFLRPDIVEQLRVYIAKTTDSDAESILPGALEIEPLRSTASDRLRSLGWVERARVALGGPSEIALDVLIDSYGESGSYNRANHIAEALLPLVGRMSEEQLLTIIRHAGENSEISGSFGLRDVLQKIVALRRLPPLKLAQALQDAGLELPEPEDEESDRDEDPFG